jgi:hypothetical protein
MIATIVESLWLRVHASLTAFADRLTTADPSLIRDLRRTKNDTFPLRGYLAFKRQTDGDEVAITIDVRCEAQQLTIEADVCSDEGQIIAGGPAATVSLSESSTTVDAAIDGWLQEFEQFLIKQEPMVRQTVAHLR